MSQLSLIRAGMANYELPATQDWKFARNKTLRSSQGITPDFTRASGGSYFDASGVLRYYGLNIALWSEDFSNAYWTKVSTTVSANSAVAPNGAITADLCYPTLNGNGRGFYKVFAHLPSGWTASIYAKSSGKRYFGLYADNGNDIGASFDLQSGTVTNVFAGHSASIVAVGNGWYRCSIASSNAPSYTLLQSCFQDAQGTSQAVTINGTDGILFWGAQMESGQTLTDYSPTTTANASAPRFDHVFNPTTNLWESRGLLIEEQRTNALIYSQTFQSWTNNNISIVTDSATSPDGTVNAAKLIPDAVSTNHRLFYAAAGSGTGSFSCYAKAAGYNFLQVRCGAGGGAVAITNFNLSNGTISNSTTVSGATITGERMTNVGNGWWRCEFSFGSVASFTTVIMPRPDSSATEGAAYSGDTTSGVLVWGVQTEAGAFPTSYIPTTSASVTRSADVCQVTGASFSGFWNATEGSFCTEYDRLFTPSGTAYWVWQIDDTTDSERIGLVYENSAAPVGDQMFIVDGGVVQARVGSTSLVAGTPGRFASRYKLNDIAGTLNGSAVNTDTSATLPTVTRWTIGYTTSSGGVYLNGHIARLRYFNKALTDKQLEDLGKPELSKSLDLQFASTRSLVPLVGPTPNFSRASSGTYFDSAGVLRTAGINTVLHSEDFTNGWYTNNDITVTANAAVAPDGTTTADKLVPTVASSVHRVFGVAIGTGTGTISCYVKSAGYNWVQLRLGAGGGVTGCVTFNLSTASVGTTVTTGGSVVSNQTITSVGNGWYRCSFTATGLSAYTSVVKPLDIDRGEGDSWSGDGTSGILAWGLQAESGTAVTDYAKTTGTATSAPRFDHTFDGTNWGSRGLLIEEQRTNTAQYSQDFANAYWIKTSSTVVSNQGVAPDGTTTADLVYPSSTGTWRGVYATGTNPATASVFAKAAGKSWIMIVQDSGSTCAWFNISNGTIGAVGAGFSASIQPVGNGFYRCAFTKASGTMGLFQIHVSDGDGDTSATANGTDGVLIWGAQAESGLFPTSYIPNLTTGSTTRSADVCSISGTAFSGMWNASEGTLNVNYDTYTPSSNTTYNTRVVAVSDSAANLHRIFISPNASAGPPSAQFFEIRHEPSGQSATLSNTPFIGGGVNVKIAGAYRVNDIAASFNGGSIQSDTSQAIPTGCDIMRLGNNPASTNYLNGHIASLQVYTIRLPNRLLITKSS